MALFTGVHHLCTFNIVAPLISHFAKNLQELVHDNVKRHIAAVTDLLMSRIDLPIARISSSLVYYVWLYILLFLLFVIGDHCSCFSDDRFQPDTVIFKSDGSDVYAYILCTWWSGVVTTKTGFKLLYVGTSFSILCMIVYLVVPIICNWRPLLLFLSRPVSARYGHFQVWWQWRLCVHAVWI